MVMNCPDEKTLSSYLDTGLSGIERRTIERHIADCSRCLDLLLVAYEAQGRQRGLLFRLIRLFRHGKDKIHLCHCEPRLKVGAKPFDKSSGLRPERSRRTKQSQRNKRSELKWLIGALILFALSFIVKRYFLQFLTASAVLGFKWAMEGEGAKRVIMIFKGMHKDQIPSDTPHDSSYR